MAASNADVLAVLSLDCRDEVEAALTTSFDQAVSLVCRRQIQAASGLPTEPSSGTGAKCVSTFCIQEFYRMQRASR
jgi:hypothetical protein